MIGALPTETKTVNGVKATYLYVGDKLMYEKRGTDEYHYSYDSYGHITNIRYYENGGAVEAYYLVTNSQGDVIAIYDGNGN